METSKIILIIEDHQKLLHVFLRYLREGHFQALCADNGEDGLALAKKFRPDLIICSISMPTMSGYDVIQDLKNDTHTANIPIVAMSPKKDSATIRYAMEQGADDYLVKPISPKEFLGTIRLHLRKSARVKEQIDKALIDTWQHLMTVIPHELRTPLSSILGSAKFMKDNFDALQKDDIIEMLGFVVDSSQRLHQLTERIILLSQIESLSHDPNRLTSVRNKLTNDASEIIIERAYSVAAEFNRTHDIRLEYIATEKAVIRIHAVYLDIIMKELMENACKFSEPGSPISIFINQEESQYIIAIEDQGRGIHPEELHKAQRLFGQLERSEFEQQGLGVGLSIVTEIVKIFNGNLFMRHRSPHGTRVEVILDIIVIPVEEKTNGTPQQYNGDTSAIHLASIQNSFGVKKIFELSTISDSVEEYVEQQFTNP